MPAVGCMRLSTEPDRDRHQLHPERCLYVGGGSQDAGFARKLGFTHSASLRPAKLGDDRYLLRAPRG